MIHEKLRRRRSVGKWDAGFRGKAICKKNLKNKGGGNKK